MKRALALAASLGLATVGLAAPAIADPPSHVHYVSGSKVWYHGCEAYLNAYGSGSGYHVQAVIYNKSIDENHRIFCQGYLERKHGTNGKWAIHGNLNAEDVGSWDATGFYKDPTNWKVRGCVKAYDYDRATYVGTRRCTPAY